MQINFKSVAQSVKTLNNKGASLWTNVVLFAVDVARVPLLENTVEPDKLASAFKANEREAEVELRVKMSENSTFKVAKSVLMSAAKLGIAVLEGGKPRGKSAIEADIKAAKGDKSPLEKFRVVMASATSIANDLTDVEAVSAAPLVQELADLVASIIASIKAAA